MSLKNSSKSIFKWIRPRQRGIYIRKLAAIWNSVLSPFVEIALIILWALWLGRAYLDFDPFRWPHGIDFPLTIEPYYVWPTLFRCGTCVLWNGFLNGGYPSFVEMHGGFLHPVVVLTTLFLGVVHGAKITLVISILASGLGQWLLARMMRLGRPARLWAGAMGVVGGHLAGKMQFGMVGMVLALATAVFVLPTAVWLARTGRRKAGVAFGCALGLSMLAGQGYIQLALIIGVLPAFAVFLFNPARRLRPLWKPFALGLVLALLVSAVFWVPFFHFLPNFTKEIDPVFSGGQPLGYLPLNLITSELHFFEGIWLGMNTIPGMYMNYIGWAPLLLIAGAMRPQNRFERRLLAFFLLSIGIIFFIASDGFVRLLAVVSTHVAEQLRYPVLALGLAVPFLIGLAAWGADRMLQGSRMKLQIRVPAVGERWISISRIAAVILMAGSLISVYQFSREWYQTYEKPLEQILTAFRVRPESALWVRPPTLSHDWVPMFLEAEMKVTQVFRPWRWEGKDAPQAYLAGYPTLKESPAGVDVLQISKYPFVLQPSASYASILSDGGRSDCAATSLGGYIDVECRAEDAGVLVVRENAWTGWYAWVDGKRVKLHTGQWLSVATQAGEHHIRFRYYPIDVPLGISISLFGIALIRHHWRRGLRSSRSP